MHSYAQSVARIRTTLFVGGASDAILLPLRTFSLDAILQSHSLVQNTTSSRDQAAGFEYHFLRAKSHNFRAL